MGQPDRVRQSAAGTGQFRGKRSGGACSPTPRCAGRNRPTATIRECAERFGLARLLNERAGNLSGGQKRLVEFARIAIASPKLVILDEPMGGVNPVLGERIGRAVREFATRGSSVLIVEHNLRFIEETCDDVVVMSLGSVIAQGPYASLRNNEAVVDAYLGAVQDHV